MYTNPRLVAEFDSWPSGGQRVKCKFEVQNAGKKGYRISKMTTNPKTGLWNKAKLSTYAGKAVIVEKDDKTFIMQHVVDYGFVKIMTHDFMDHETVHSSSNLQKYNELLDVIDSQYGTIIPDDFEVQPLGRNENPKGKSTCGTCGLSWDDDICTSWTPAPAARCPFEHFHKD